MGALPVLAEFQTHLAGLDVAVFSGVFGNPTCSQVMDGAVAYKAHKAYMAADYLRRLVATTEKASADPNAPVVTSPVDVIVDLLVTIQPVVENLDDIWAAFDTRYHWTTKRIARLQKMVGEARTPILVKKPTERRLHAIAV